MSFPGTYARWPLTPGKFVFFCTETEDMEQFDSLDEATGHAAGYGDQYTRVVFQTLMVLQP